MTVTDPEMTRFITSIGDAVDLALYVFNHGKPGNTRRLDVNGMADLFLTLDII